MSQTSDPIQMRMASAGTAPQSESAPEVLAGVEMIGPVAARPELRDVLPGVLQQLAGEVEERASAELRYVEACRREQALRAEAEAALHALAESQRPESSPRSYDIVAALDTQFRFLAFNEAFARVFREHYGVEITIGSSLLEATASSPKNQSHAREIWGRALRGDEYLIQCAFGEGTPGVRHYEMAFRNVWSASGERIGTCQVARNVTARVRAEEAMRRARNHLEQVVAERTAELQRINVRLEDEIGERSRIEQQLRESEERFALTFDYAAVGFAHVAPDGHWLRINDEFCRITGYTRQELIGRTFRDITHPEDLAEELRLVDQLREGKLDRYTFQKRYIRKDGSAIWTSMIRSIVRNADGSPRCFISIVEDIDQRKRAEEALARSEQQLRTILDHLPVGVWLADAGGTVILGNPAVHEIWGGAQYVGVEGYGQYQAWWHDTGRALAPADWSLPRALASRKPVTHDVLDIQTFDGRRRTILNSAIPVLGSDGQTLAAVVINEDVTERIRAEREREDLLKREQEARAAAESATHRRDQCLAILSHELRTPLTPVLARLELLQRMRHLPPSVRQALASVAQHVELEARLIDDLLDMSRIVTRTIELRQRRVDIHRRLRSALDVHKPAIKAKKLCVRLSLKARSHIVQGDSGRLEQVFWQLIGNAVKFTPPEGQIHISTENTWNGRLLVHIEDTGVGIDATAMGRLFTAFEQEDPVLSRRFGGLGLGLSTAQALVELHGGSIAAVSEGRNRGALLTVELPVAPVAKPERRRPQSRSAPRRRSVSRPARS